MMKTHKIGISLSIIGVAAVLMVVTAPTLENHQAISVTQPVVKKVSTKDRLARWLRNILLGK
jgi:hypothetical protein